MNGNLTRFMHFTGTHGYGYLKIDNKDYKITKLEMINGFGLGMNTTLEVPLKVKFDVNADTNEIIRIQSI